MSTEQPNNNAANAASQTLFRFTSLRNPQLTETKNNDNFILRNFLTTGYFDKIIQEWYNPPAKGLSKLDYLLQKIKENSDVVSIKKNEKDLKPLLGLFYETGKVLAQKRDWENTKDLDLLISQIQIKTQNETSIENKLLNPTSSELKSVWDSLIYQVLTQENFYVKEIIIQVLQAINYYTKYNEANTEVGTQKLLRMQSIASAKVVIPNFLFIDSAIPQDEATAFTVNETEIGGSYIYEMDKLNQLASPSIIHHDQLSDVDYTIKSTKMELAIALHQRNELELLKKELKKEQKLYKKIHSNTYSAALKEHQDFVKNIIEEYESEITEIENNFTSDMNEAQRKEALNNITMPIIPDFQFQKKEERDLDIFSQKLSKESMDTFIKLFGSIESSNETTSKLNNGTLNHKNVIMFETNSVVFPNDEYITFDEIFEKIDETLLDSIDDVKAKAEVNKEQYLKLGSVLIPVNKSEETTFAYSFMAESRAISSGFRTSYRWGFYLTLNLPDSAWGISSVSYNLQSSMGINAENSYFTFTRDNGTIFLTNLFSNNLELSRNDIPVNFDLDIVFTNGETSKITINRPMISQQLFVGTFNIGEEENLDTQNNVFVPNGFGIKRLGVADYMKIEQSTHAYVEGEVANIENIMAREYRDKSTRRLRRSEITDSSSTETEREKLSDTTTVNRYEMQTEVAKILQEDKNKEAHTSINRGDLIKYEVGGSFANHTSKETATRQAVSKSQDITARALDRIVSKVKQERVEKVIEEFEENNSHGFDNRKGDKHVVGVYRWVDKLMKNQIFNYGKRMMLEFMIPQPAKLHNLAVGKIPNSTILEKPSNPKTDAYNQMADAASATETLLQYWADYYNVSLDAKPYETQTFNVDFDDSKVFSSFAKTYPIEIPANFVCTNVHVKEEFQNTFPSILQADDFKGGMVELKKSGLTYDVSDLSLEGIINFKYVGAFLSTLNFWITLTCETAQSVINQWKQEQFTKIIAAYDKALKEWEEKIAAIENESEEEKAKEENTQYYRQIEEVILKHNCIAYLLQNYSKLGTKLYKGTDVKNFKVLLGKDLNDYTALAKFMEQAFEWEIMDYTFYPYYWGNKEDWKTMYLSESIDPLFRSFLQAGMGRVVVTVKPGFEDAVNFYLATGKIWNGGEVPVIGDPLYLSITDEMREPQGEKYGKAWVTRIPTSLTILQAESIGLTVEHALPFTTEDPNEFENPKELMTDSNFSKLPDVVMQSPEGKTISNIEINNDYLQLTTNDNPHQVVSQLSLDDLKDALQ